MAGVPVSGVKLGRNELCPTCGRKVKRCACVRSRRRRALPWLIALTLAGLSVMVGVFLGSDGARTGPELLDAEGLRAYEGAAVPDRWLLDGNEEPERWLQVVEPQERRIRSLLARYAGASPLAGKIVRAFPSFYLSSFEGGISVAHARKGEEFKIGALELCFIPRAGFEFNHPSACYYREDWHALMVAAVAQPDALFANVLFHELGHALQHRERGNAPQPRDAFLDEEVAMHELGTAVLDTASGGKFSARVSEIVGRFPERASVAAVLGGVTLADMGSLDRLFTPDPLGARAARLAGGQYEIEIGFRVIARRGGGAGERRTFYDKLYRR